MNPVNNPNQNLGNNNHPLMQPHNPSQPPPSPQPINIVARQQMVNLPNLQQPQLHRQNQQQNQQQLQPQRFQQQPQNGFLVMGLPVNSAQLPFQGGLGQVLMTRQLPPAPSH